MPQHNTCAEIAMETAYRLFYGRSIRFDEDRIENNDQIEPLTAFQLKDCGLNLVIESKNKFEFQKILDLFGS